MTDAQTFARNLDLSEARAIERRLAELAPAVEEAAALRARLINVHRRLGVESHARKVDRSIEQLLVVHPAGMARGLIIRDLEQPPHIIKSSLRRLQARGRVHSPNRGYYQLAPRPEDRTNDAV